MLETMNSRHNQPRYRFLEPPPKLKENETPEERLKRLLEAPRKVIADNQSFLAALRATVQSEQK